MGTNILNIKLIDSVEEAPNYELPEWSGLSLDRVLIVRKGTVGGNPTLDLQLTDDTGQKYVAMVTGAILEMIAGAVRSAKDE